MEEVRKSIRTEVDWSQKRKDFQMEMEMEMKGNIPTKFGNMEWEINLNPCGDQVFLGITHES